MASALRAVLRARPLAARLGPTSTLRPSARPVHVVGLLRPASTLSASSLSWPTASVRAALRVDGTRRYWAGVGRRYIPGAITQQQAKEKIAAWVKGQNLANSGFAAFIAGQQPSPCYVPFWLFESHVRVSVDGLVGYDRMELQYNHRSNRFEHVSVTDWRAMAAEYDSSHKNDSHELHIDASLQLRDAHLQRLKAPYAALHSSLPFDAAATQSATILQPVVGSQEAWRSQVEPLITRRERDNAARVLQQRSGASRVQVQSLSLDVKLARCFCLFVPAYLLPFEQGGLTRHVVANGLTGEVAGDVVLSTWRTALAGAAGGLALGLVGRLAGTESSVFACTLVGAVCAYAWARGGASLFAYVEAGLRGLTAASLQHGGRPHFEYYGFEFETASFGGGGFGDWGGQQQQQQQQQGWGRQQQQRQGWGRQQAQHTQQARGRSYYDVLGVSRRATTEEIKTAFRKEALKWHPDRQTDAGKKVEAERRFKEVNEAYRVLRSDQERRRYDATL